MMPEQVDTLDATEVAAPAKVNLALLVGPVRPDGFHELASLMVPVTLGDLVVVRQTPGEDLTVECAACPGEQNLAARMVRELEARLERSFEVAVTVRKQIPVGAGLAGGCGEAVQSGRAGRGLMQYLLIALPLILLVVFLGVWQKLRRTYRRRLDGEGWAGAQDDLDQLLAMKAKLTEEEYRQLRQAVVKKITASPQEQKPVSKEVNLAALERELMCREAERRSRPAGGAQGKA